MGGTLTESRRILGPGQTELLSPARDFACGKAAVDCGADAVYVGAPLFGAREAAANPVEDIAALAAYAHRFRARVYVALNTLLTDQELGRAAALARELAGAGADGLIIQDFGLLDQDLPDLPLIASTQAHNATPARAAFLAGAGFSRAILARELSHREIRAVREAAEAAGGIELEAFVHGALCVSLSGRCYLSLALGGRSANRGRCAQPCRRWYRAEDAEGRAVGEGHLLSLRDLALHRRLGDLLDGGVTSFKIEGRLKDEAYVANVTAFYRARLDSALGERGLKRSSSGESEPGFEPDLEKTFNRGFTEFFLDGAPPREKPGTPATPKMVGEEVGRVEATRWGSGGVEVLLDRQPGLAPGDGVAWFDGSGTLTGSSVHASAGRVLRPDRPAGLAPGRVLYRNRDQAFLSALAAARPRRRIPVRLSLGLTSGGLEGGLTLAVVDADGVRAQARIPGPVPAAEKQGAAREALEKALGRTGDTVFSCSSIDLDLRDLPFLTVSSANALRREALDALATEREKSRPRPRRPPLPGGDEPLPPGGEPVEPGTEGDFSLNVLNRAAAGFHRRHGVEPVEPAAEAGTSLEGRRVMTCRYCLRHQLDRCPEGAKALGLPQSRGSVPAKPAAPGPWDLVDDEGRRFTVVFDCSRCGMEIYLGRPRSFRGR